MDQIDPASLVEGYDGITHGLKLPDADDRHVLAAAIHAKAAFLVTFNTRDFPDEVLTQYGLLAIHPDDFLCDLLGAFGFVFLVAASNHRRSLSRPPKDAQGYLGSLLRIGLPKLADQLTAHAGEI